MHENAYIDDVLGTPVPPPPPITCNPLFVYGTPKKIKKIQKLGFIMLWIPEPTGITCAVGGPMILAGRYLDKVYNGSKISDIGNHTKDTFSTLHDFKRTIS